MSPSAFGRLLAAQFAMLSLSVSSIASSAVIQTAVNPGNGHTYHLLSSAGWTDSETEAVLLGGHLATVNDADENEWIANTFNSDNSIHLWIGFNDVAAEGNFTWVSGESPTFTQWDVNQPDNGAGGATEQWAHLGHSPSPFVWNDFQDLAFHQGQGKENFGVVEVPFPAPTLDISDPNNILAGAIVASSTEVNSQYTAADSVDGLVRANPSESTETPVALIFGINDPEQRLGVSGFSGSVARLRLWTIPVESDGRVPAHVTILSSVNGLVGADLTDPLSFESAHGTFNLGVNAFSGTIAGTDNTYVDLAVVIPAGTQSLLLNFGSGGQQGDRITEVQAFPAAATVPSMSPALALTTGVIFLGIGLFAMWRRDT